MTVYYDKEAKGYKYHFQYKGKHYKSKKFKTKKQAEMAERKKRNELNGNVLFLSNLIKKRLDDYELHDQMQTRAKLEQMYRCRVQPYIEDKDVSQYTSQDIYEMAAHLKAQKPIHPYEGRMKKQSNYSINYTVKHLKAVFNWGIRMGYCHDNPCRTFENLKYIKSEKVFWTEEQFNTAVMSVDPKDYKLIARLEVFFWTGMRRSEANDNQ